MINHGRTLLLNIWAQSAQKQQAGYEYISNSYRPLVLPTALKTVRKILFGSNPDQRFLNLRSRELLSYIHQTPLADYLYKLDSRITYWPEISETVFKYQPAIRITQVDGAKRSVAVGGDFVANNNIGRATRLYTVGLYPANPDALAAEQLANLTLEEGNGVVTEELEPDTELFLTAQTVSTPESDTTAEFAVELPPITLPETQVRLRMERLSTDPLTLTGRWYVVLDSNPAPAITTLLPALELLGEPLFLELFGVTDEEPYATFKNMWFDHPLPAYRLAGLVTAFIYRIESVRTHTYG
jgi:hypothetical protein